MATLYDITGRALALMQMADDEDIEPEVFKDTLDGIEGEFDDKIETYCKVIKNIEADAKAVAEELKRLQTKKKHLENTVSRMKQTIYEAMKLTGKTSSGGTILKASIQKNGGVLPLIMDEPVAEDLPEEYRIIEYKADNEAIRKALDEGKELPFAHYGERGESIRIK
jgi:hypothetical protein